MHYYVIILFSASASFGSAASDALVDGLIAEQSSHEEIAVQQRCASEYGRLTGGVLTGTLAWLGGLTFFYVFGLSALAWFSLFSIFFLGIKAEGNHNNYKQRSALSVAEFLSKHNVLIALVTFLVCVTPNCDLFQYRKQAWKFTASDQTLVSTVSSIGWISGVTFYKNVSKKWNWCSTFRMTLIIWCLHPPIALAVVHLVNIFLQNHDRSFMLFTFAIIERCTALFATAMTFMPCNVGMQLCCRSGTAFALLQLVGALGSTVGRNLDFRLQMHLGVTVEDMHNYPNVLMVFL